MLPPDASNDKCQDSLLEATGVNLTYSKFPACVPSVCPLGKKVYLCSRLCYFDKFSSKIFHLSICGNILTIHCQFFFLQDKYVYNNC